MRRNEPPAPEPSLTSLNYQIIVILLLGVLAYGNTFYAPFYVDDEQYVMDNEQVKSLSNIPSMFAHGPRPTTISTLAINYAMGGYSLPGYHVFNITLHLVNALLLYFLVLYTARDRGLEGQPALMMSFAAAAVFALHPIQTQAVTYIISRSVLLSTACYLGGLHLIRHIVRAGSHKGASMAGLYVLCLLGAGSKEIFATFPAVALMYDYVFLSDRSLKRVADNWKAHLAGVVSWLYIAYLMSEVMSQPDAYGSTRHTKTPAIDYLMTQFNVHMTYLRLLVLPYNQTFFYDYPIAKTLWQMPTALSFVGYALLWIGGAVLLWRWPVAGFCILWFMVTLTPDSSVLSLRPIFEHRLYLPSIGAFTLAAVGAVALARRRGWGMEALSKAVLVLCLVLAALTFMRNNIWADSMLMWEDNARKAPDNEVVHYDLSFAYIKNERYEDAKAALRRAIELEPRYFMAYYNLGLLHLQDDPARAIENIKIYSAQFPYVVNAHIYMGNAYLSLGQVDEGIASYERALLLRQDSDLYVTVGVLYLKQKNMPQQALQYGQRALELQPGNPRAQELLEAASSQR